MPVSLPVGEQFKVHLPGALRASWAFSYSDTDHYYVGTDRNEAIETNVAPATRGMEHVLGLEYDLSRGFTLVGEVPLAFVEQSRELGGVAGTMEARGLGDLRLLARRWFAQSAAGTSWYGALGLRLPTGESDGMFTREAGDEVTRDLAAQAGTGNLAWIVELGGSRPLGERLGLGFSARYVITPSATTVNNFRHELTGTGPEKNSDSDALSARLSLLAPLSTGDGALSTLSAQALLDWAWIPYDDLVGDTEGFRRAGPIVTLGPGLAWAPTDALSASLALPFTLYRDVQRNGGNVQEWLLQLSLSWSVRAGGLH